MHPYHYDNKIYKCHVANIRSIELAITNVALSARNAIANNNKTSETSFTRLYAFLIGAWAENRLNKLLYEQNGFNDDERLAILTISNQYDRWLAVIECAFRKHYNIPKAIISEATLPFSIYNYYLGLQSLLEDDLRIIIEVRNKLAHGQWIYPFNNDGTKIESEKFRLINLENLMSLQFKYKLISHLTDIINDLVVSLPAFERDFNDHYRQIVETRRNLKNRKYEKYRENLIKKLNRGKQKRNM